ncbi:MAG: hypothetical protein II896_06510 [Clostridia bacterium]|nr:hypothetical protein [Clostridia bacterium]
MPKTKQKGIGTDDGGWAAALSSFVFGLVGLRLMLKAFRRAMPLFGFYTLALSIVALFV